MTNVRQRHDDDALVYQFFNVILIGVAINAAFAFFTIVDFTGFIREVVTNIFMRIFNVAFQLGKKLKGRRDFFWLGIGSPGFGARGNVSTVMSLVSVSGAAAVDGLTSLAVSVVSTNSAPWPRPALFAKCGHQRFVDFPFAAHWACHMTFIAQGVKGSAILKPRIEVVFVGTA